MIPARGPQTKLLSIVVGVIVVRGKYKLTRTTLTYQHITTPLNLKYDITPQPQINKQSGQEPLRRRREPCIGTETKTLRWHARLIAIDIHDKSNKEKNH